MIERRSPRSVRGDFRVALLLATAFVALNFAILATGGVRVQNDSHVFIRGADNLLSGRPLEGKQSAYGSYLFLVALSKWAGLGLAGVIATQIGAAGLAGVALYDLGRRLGGTWAGAIAAATLVANPDVARWHAYVYTDSLYISLVVLAAWGIDRAADRRGSWYALASAVVLAAASVRPNGWLLLPLAAGYWILRALPGRWPQRLGIAGVAVAFGLGALLLPVFRDAVQRESPDRLWRVGEVVRGYPEGRLIMPADPAPEPGWPAAFGYVLQHPFASARLAATRVLVELAHVRPFYSTWHNIAIVMGLAPLYLLAVLGFLGVHTEPLARLLVAVTGAHLLVVALTFANWDGRFLLHVLPLIGTLAGCGGAQIVNVLSALPALIPRRGRGSLV